MSLKEMSHFLCGGNTGGKFGKIAVNDFGFKATFDNGSKQDLKLLGNMPNTYHLQNFDGFGGHRERAIDCLLQNPNYMEVIQNIKEKIIFIPFGAGGSYGSGMAPIKAEALVEKVDEYGVPEKIVCPIVALPSSNEASVKHHNAYQVVQELQEIDGLGATFFIDNDSHNDYNYINTTFMKMLDVFLSNDSYGEINNFDEAERIEMLRNPGAMIFSLVGCGKEQSIMLEKLTKNGIFAPIESNFICENVGIIHAGKDNSDINASTVIAEVGKPANVFEGYNGRSTLIAVSGLSYPVSHVRKLGELAQKVSAERQRNRNISVQKLDDLQFEESVSFNKAEKVQKKPSKLAALRQQQAKMQQN